MKQFLIKVTSLFVSTGVIWLMWDWVVQGMFPTAPDMGYWYAFGARLLVWNLIGLDSIARYITDEQRR